MSKKMLLVPPLVGLLLASPIIIGTIIGLSYGAIIGGLIGFATFAFLVGACGAVDYLTKEGD